MPNNLIPIRTASATALAAAAAIVANVFLGLSSLFWRTLAAIPSESLLCYRILISLGTLVLVKMALGSFKGLSKISAKVLRHHFIAASLVAINWGTFIWASINGHVLESGIGYLIAPFIGIGAGFIVFRDRVSWIRCLAIIAMIAGILLLVLRSGELNFIVYLVIGATWGSYACLKKTTPLDAFAGLFVETAVLSILLCIAIPISRLSLILPQHVSASTLLLLASCGLVSIIPLWLFSYAARNLDLSVMGFFQFVLPITQLIVSLIFYHQPVSKNSFICFSIICAALLLIICEPWLIGSKQNNTKIPSRSYK